MLARVEHLEQSVDTKIAQHGADLAENRREVVEKIYQFDSKEYQQTVIEEIKSDYKGVVDKLSIRNGNIINGGNVSEYPVSLQAVEHTLGNPKVFYKLSQWLRNR